MSETSHDPAATVDETIENQETAEETSKQVEEPAVEASATDAAESQNDEAEELAEAEADVVADATSEPAEEGEPVVSAAPDPSEAADEEPAAMASSTDEPDTAGAPEESPEAATEVTASEQTAAETTPDPEPIEAEAVAVESSETDAASVAPESETVAAADPEPAAETKADESTEAQSATAEPAAAKPKSKKRRKRPTKKAPKQSVELSPEAQALAELRDAGTPVEGRVFGWNNGGFHVVVNGVAAFCPRSELGDEAKRDPDELMDQTLEFRILRIEEGGRRIIVSRAALKRGVEAAARATLEVGAVITGTVASLTEFGAFVDLGGVEGLVHVSEISRQRVANPSDVLEVGQQVEVKIIKMERGGRRISLSMKALLPDPWRDVEGRYEAGTVVTGTVERTVKIGSFIALEPGLTGLLPTSEMGLPREALPARIYPPGREVKIQIVSIDPRRKRIGLAPEGSRLGGSRHDYLEYVKDQKATETVEGFGALASAFKRADQSKI